MYNNKIFLLSIFIIFSSCFSAKEQFVKNESFTLDLPENWVIEPDSHSLMHRTVKGKGKRKPSLIAFEYDIQTVFHKEGKRVIIKRYRKNDYRKYPSQESNSLYEWILKINSNQKFKCKIDIFESDKYDKVYIVRKETYHKSRYLTMYIKKNNKLYVLSYRSKSDVYDYFLKDVNFIMSSFKIKK